MTALLLDQAHDATSPFERLERIAAWEKIIAWAQAQQYTEITGCVEAAEQAPPDGYSPTDAAESTRAEIGLILRLTAGSTTWRVEEAQKLVGSFPTTHTALRAGAITLAKARIILDGCADLSTHTAARVEAHVLQRAPQQTTGQLRAALRRAVLREDADAAARRATRKRRERTVILYPERDGMATFSATLPAVDAVGIFAVLDQHARACTGTDDRTMDARRADTLVDLILGETGFTTSPNESTDTSEAATTETATGAPVTGATGHGGAGNGAGTETADRATTVVTNLPGIAATAAAQADDARATMNTVSVQIRVTVPYDTLRGVSDEPGELAGYGPVTADQARDLAADPKSTWYRLVTDPLSGALLDYGTTRYRPPPHLAEHLIARHRTCQYPGCRVPAHRCDLDHNIPYGPDSGGTTSDANIGPKCRPHHRLKGRNGWHVTQYTDGTILWITPSGHTYRVEPPPVAEPRPDPTPASDEPPPF